MQVNKDGRYFYEVTSVFMAAVLVTADEYEEKSRRQDVWDRRHVLIPRTAPALSVVFLAPWQTLNLDGEMLAFNLIHGLAPRQLESQIWCTKKAKGLWLYLDQQQFQTTQEKPRLNKAVYWIPGRVIEIVWPVGQSKRWILQQFHGFKSRMDSKTTIVAFPPIFTENVFWSGCWHLGSSKRSSKDPICFEACATLSCASMSAIFPPTHRVFFVFFSFFFLSWLKPVDLVHPLHTASLLLVHWSEAHRNEGKTPSTVQQSVFFSFTPGKLQGKVKPSCLGRRQGTWVK